MAARRESYSLAQHGAEYSKQRQTWTEKAEQGVFLEMDLLVSLSSDGNIVIRVVITRM